MHIACPYDMQPCLKLISQELGCLHSNTHSAVSIDWHILFSAYRGVPLCMPASLSVNMVHANFEQDTEGHCRPGAYCTSCYGAHVSFEIVGLAFLKRSNVINANVPGQNMCIVQSVHTGMRQHCLVPGHKHIVLVGTKATIQLLPVRFVLHYPSPFAWNA